MSKEFQTVTPSAQPGQSLCLLSIDGGGVRGLSALYIIDQLMNSINDKAQNDPPLEPCEYFDMICGTSTGGLIAIMLGRLRMSVQECIEAYLRLSDSIFRRIHLLPINLGGRTHGRYNQEALEAGIRQILRSRQMAEDTLLRDDDPSACKVFVCSLRQQINTVVQISSYRSLHIDRDLLNNATIVQACLATSAAPTYFEPVRVQLGPRDAPYIETFVDAGTGYNNPINQLWEQALDIWKAPLEDKIQCLVSIGTGKPTLPDLSSSAVDLGRRLLAIATDSENAAGQFYRNHRHSLCAQGRYFRFNVDRGLESVDLGETQQKSRIIGATKVYLRNGEVMDKMDVCAERLSTRDSWTSKARGELICSKWLWYPIVQDDYFVIAFISHMSTLGYKVLHVDYSKAISREPIPFPPSLAARSIKSDIVCHIILSLICQALQDRDFAQRAEESALMMLLKECVRESAIQRGQNSVPSSVRFLAHVFRGVINLQPTSDVVVVLNHINDLDGEDLELVRNTIQDIMDAQRTPSVAQMRSFLIAEASVKSETAFKGFAKVNKWTEYLECMSSLSFKSMNLRRDRIITVDIDDSSWLWSHAAYQEWLKHPHGLLWIKGKPGSGKSVLAKAIQRRYRKDVRETHAFSDASSADLVICSWFYSARDGLISHLTMMRVVLLQMLNQEREYFEAMKTVYRGLKRRKREPQWSWVSLQAAFSAITKSTIGRRSIFLVLDGLDESRMDAAEDDVSRNEAIRFLTELSNSFRILVMSRSTHDIDRTLRKSFQIVMEKENLPNVKRAIEQGLASLVNLLSSDDDDDSSGSDDQEASFPGSSDPFHSMKQTQNNELERMRSYLLEHAEGVILWVVAVISSVRMLVDSRPSFELHQLRRAIERLPTDVEALYESIIENLEKSSAASIEFGCRALAWVNVATSRRPFQLGELLEAMRIPRIFDGSQDANPFVQVQMQGVRSPSTFFAHLQKYCGAFIEIIPTEQGFPHNVAARRREIELRDQVQLLHQSAKVFLESSEAAGPFRLSFKRAEQLVLDECSRYVHLALPIRDYPYVPIMDTAVAPNMDGVLQYLETRALLPYILSTLPILWDEVPPKYRFIFEKATDPRFTLPIATFSAEYQVVDTSAHAEIVQAYFRAACQKGYAIAIENLFYLSSLRFGSSQWQWYREEVAIIHGAMLVAIQNRLHTQVWKLAWYIGQRGLDLLDLSLDLRGNEDKQSKLIRATLATRDLDICMFVIGYRDEMEKNALMRYLEARDNQHRTESSRYESTRAENPRVIAAIEAIIGFWGKPPKPTDSLAEFDDTDTDTNDWGPSLNAGHFDSNVSSISIGYESSQRQMFMSQMRPYNTMQGGVRKIPKGEWLSHKDLDTHIARLSVVRGGRNANIDVVNTARRAKLATHLDGARLLNAVVATGVTAEDYARPFDSVWVDLTKGLGGPVGAVLAGSHDFIQEAWRFKHRFGGAMRQSGFLAAAGLYALDHHMERLKNDHDNAKLLAEGLARMPGVLVSPEDVSTNLVYFDVERTGMSAVEFVDAAKAKGIELGAQGPTTIRAVTHIDISRVDVADGLKVLREVVSVGSRDSSITNK